VDFCIVNGKRARAEEERHRLRLAGIQKDFSKSARLPGGVSPFLAGCSTYACTSDARHS
jgi:hypothetical protein